MLPKTESQKSRSLRAECSRAEWKGPACAHGPQQGGEALRWLAGGAGGGGWALPASSMVLCQVLAPDL